MTRPSRRQLRCLEARVAERQRRQREVGKVIVIGFNFQDGSTAGLVYRTTAAGGLKLLSDTTPHPGD